MFSIVIPLYNKEVSVSNTIQSVLDQTVIDFEILIINDGSTDNSLEVVKNINDPRIHIIDKSNGGVSSARNRGIKEAKFKWICFLDADDIWEPNHLAILKDLIIKFPLDKVFCTSYTRGLRKEHKDQDLSILIIEDYFKEAIKYPFFWTSIVCIERAVFDNLGLFKEHLTRGEDLEMWSRVGDEYRVIRSNCITAEYVQYSENKLTKSKSNLSKSFINEISLSGAKGSKKKYLKKVIREKVLNLILSKDFNTAFSLIMRHNLSLL
ncbi:glycosyltransferase family 2 protein [Sphingobacterium thalpophilum]|uniref:glycosyltransferase family 2 protein n=1 Tax=Sphingobacterium thalpophilum TaxID=259 RepID=UPI003C71DF12